MPVNRDLDFDVVKYGSSELKRKILYFLINNSLFSDK